MIAWNDNFIGNSSCVFLLYLIENLCVIFVGVFETVYFVSAWFVSLKILFLGIPFNFTAALQQDLCDVHKRMTSLYF